jgi:hypothetical protein
MLDCGYPECDICMTNLAAVGKELDTDGCMACDGVCQGCNNIECDDIDAHKCEFCGEILTGDQNILWYPDPDGEGIVFCNGDCAGAWFVLECQPTTIDKIAAGA